MPAVAAASSHATAAPKPTTAAPATKPASAPFAITALTFRAINPDVNGRGAIPPRGTRLHAIGRRRGRERERGLVQIAV